MMIIREEKNGKTLVQIRDKEKIVEEIDLTPVEEIRNKFEKILKEREDFSDRSPARYSVEIMEKIKTLNKSQLEYLTNNLTELVVKYADLLQLIYDNPEEQCEKIKGYKEIFQKAKEITKTELQ